MNSKRLTKIFGLEPGDSVQHRLFGKAVHWEAFLNGLGNVCSCGVAEINLIALADGAKLALSVVCDHENTLFAAVTATLETDFQHQHKAKVFGSHLPGRPKSLGNIR